MMERELDGTVSLFCLFCLAFQQHCSVLTAKSQGIALLSPFARNFDRGSIVWKCQKLNMYTKY